MTKHFLTLDDLGTEGLCELLDRSAELKRLLQQRRTHLQPDQEQQDHHAELGEGHHVARFTHQVQGERPHDQACDEVTQHRSQPEPLGDGHRDHARGQIDQGLEKEGVSRHWGRTMP